MIKRFVKMSFHSQYIDEFTSIFKTSRHSIKGFAGCKHVELLQDELHPTTFFTFSIWES